jgi:hypothetical protein
MPLPLPPLANKPADTAANWTRGAAIGAEIGRANAQIAMEQQRLQAQMAQAAMEAQVRQEQIQQNARLEQQRTEIAAAYHQAQIGMQQQRLEEAKQLHSQNLMMREAGLGIQAGRLEETKRMNQMKAEQAAAQMQAKGMMQERVKEYVAGGMPEGEAMMRASSEFAAGMNAPAGSVMATARIAAQMEQQAKQAKIANALAERRMRVSEQGMEFRKAMIPSQLKAIESDLTFKRKQMAGAAAKRALEMKVPAAVALQKEIDNLEMQKKQLVGLAESKPGVTHTYNPATGEYVPVSSEEPDEEAEYPGEP